MLLSIISHPVTFSALLFLCFTELAAGLEIQRSSEPTWMSSSQIKTWREIQRQDVEMQNYDYSCGSAALATLLREFYNVETNEERVLQRMGKAEAASLSDLARVAESYGFKAVGYSIPLSNLLRLKVPAIVHLLYQGEGHFSVVKGVSLNGLIALADSSWGNQNLLVHQFVELWDADGTGEGKVLLIIPAFKGKSMRRDFFAPPKGAVSAYDVLRLIRQPVPP